MERKIWRGFVVALSLSILSACTWSSSDTIQPLAPDIAKTGYVESVDIKSVPFNAPEGFKELLLVAIEQESKSCATGSRPLRLEAEVATISIQNPFRTALAGDANNIKGAARLLDPTTNAVLGDFDIAHSFGWTGIVGAAYLSDGAHQLARAYAEEICKLAFHRG